jgi:ribosome-associated toxin RatA of RatAB toxin-antitoxin module
MPRVERSVLVHYSAEQMFDLVANVEDYPQFLPWCSGSRVVPEHGGGLDASVELDYRGIRSRFTTRNQLRYPEQIRMTLVEGPFRSLEGVWHFHALRSGACKVQLSLHYEFANGLLGRAVAPVFDIVANSMIDAFADRAERIYGPTE